MKRTVMLFTAALLALTPALEADAKDKGKGKSKNKDKGKVTKVKPGKVKIKIGKNGIDVKIKRGDGVPVRRVAPVIANPGVANPVIANTPRNVPDTPRATPNRAPVALAPASLSLVPEPRPDRLAMANPETVITGLGPAPAEVDTSGPVAVITGDTIVTTGPDADTYEVERTEIDEDVVLATRDCPPGLAKKDPACVPPGLAKKMDDGELTEEEETVEIASLPPADAAPSGNADIMIYAPGDRITADNSVAISDPGEYGLDPYYDYYRVGESVYRVDPATLQVIAFMGALSELGK